MVKKKKSKKSTKNIKNKLINDLVEITHTEQALPPEIGSYDWIQMKTDHLIYNAWKNGDFKNVKDENFLKTLLSSVLNENAKIYQTKENIIVNEPKNYEVKRTYTSTTFDDEKNNKISKNEIEEKKEISLLNSIQTIEKLDELIAKITKEYWIAKRKYILLNDFLKDFYDNKEFKENKINFDKFEFLPFKILKEEKILENINNHTSIIYYDKNKKA